MAEVRQSKKDHTLREKLLAHVKSNETLLDESFHQQVHSDRDDRFRKETSDSTFVAAYEFYTLRKYEPKSRVQISKKIKKALNKFKENTKGKDLDILEEQNIVSMLSNLSQQQLNEFNQSTNPTLLQLQIMNQGN